MSGSLDALKTKMEKTKSYGIDQKTCFCKSGFNGNYVGCYFVWATLPLVLTATCWPILRREQFWQKGNPNHYSLLLIYYDCNSGPEGGQISRVRKSTDNLLCLHQSNKKGERRKTARRHWKHLPRNRSSNVSHPLFTLQKWALEPKSFWLLLCSNDCSNATCLWAVGQTPLWAFFIMARPPGG